MEEALKKASKVLREAERINAISSDRLTNETISLFHQIMKEFGAHFNVPGAGKERIIRDLKREPDPSMKKQPRASSTKAVLTADDIIVYGTEIFHSHPITSSYIRRASKKGANLVTIGPKNDPFRFYSSLSITPRNIESLNEAVTEMIKNNLTDTSNLSKVNLQDNEISSEEVSKMSSIVKETNNAIIVIGPTAKQRETLISISKISSLAKARIISLNYAANQIFKELKTDELHNSPDVAYIFASDYRNRELSEMKEIAKKADFVIVQSARYSELTEIADIVLPAQDWFERNGNFIDVNGKEKQITQIIEPRNGVTDQEVLRSLRIISDQEALRGLR